MNELKMSDFKGSNESKAALQGSNNLQHQHWKEFVCGGGSAFCNILISYPLNKVIFRQVRIFFSAVDKINTLEF